MGSDPKNQEIKFDGNIKRLSEVVGVGTSDCHDPKPDDSEQSGDQNKNKSREGNTSNSNINEAEAPPLRWSIYSMRDLAVGARTYFNFLKNPTAEAHFVDGNEENTDNSQPAPPNYFERMRLVADLFFQEEMMVKAGNNMGRLAISIMELAGKQHNRIVDLPMENDKGKGGEKIPKGKELLYDRPLHFMTLQNNSAIYSMITIDPLVKTAFEDNAILRRGMLTDGALFRGIIDEKTHAATITEGYNSYNLAALSDTEWTRIVRQIAEQSGLKFSYKTNKISRRTIREEIEYIIHLLRLVDARYDKVFPSREKDGDKVFFWYYKLKDLDEKKKIFEISGRNDIFQDSKKRYIFRDLHNSILIQKGILQSKQKEVKGALKTNGPKKKKELDIQLKNCDEALSYIKNIQELIIPTITTSKDGGGQWYFWPGCLFRIPSFVDIVLDPDVDKTRLVVRQAADDRNTSRNEEEQIIVDENNNALNISVIGSLAFYEKIKNHQNLHTIKDQPTLNGQINAIRNILETTNKEQEKLKAIQKTLGEPGKVSQPKTSNTDSISFQKKQFAPGFYVRSTSNRMDPEEYRNKRATNGLVKDFERVNLGIENLEFYDIEKPLTVEKTISKPQFSYGVFRFIEKALTKSVLKEICEKPTKDNTEKIQKRLEKEIFILHNRLKRELFWSAISIVQRDNHNIQTSLFTLTKNLKNHMVKTEFKNYPHNNKEIAKFLNLHLPLNSDTKLDTALKSIAKKVPSLINDVDSNELIKAIRSIRDTVYIDWLFMLLFLYKEKKNLIEFIKNSKNEDFLILVEEEDLSNEIKFHYNQDEGDLDYTNSPHEELAKTLKGYKDSIVKLLAKKHNSAGGEASVGVDPSYDFSNYTKEDIRKAIGMILKDIYINVDSENLNLLSEIPEFDDERGKQLDPLVEHLLHEQYMRSASKKVLDFNNIYTGGRVELQQGIELPAHFNPEDEEDLVDIMRYLQGYREAGKIYFSNKEKVKRHFIDIAKELLNDPYFERYGLDSKKTLKTLETELKKEYQIIAINFDFEESLMDNQLKNGVISFISSAIILLKSEDFLTGFDDKPVEGIEPDDIDKALTQWVDFFNLLWLMTRNSAPRRVKEILEFLNLEALETQNIVEEDGHPLISQVIEYAPEEGGGKQVEHLVGVKVTEYTGGRLRLPQPHGYHFRVQFPYSLPKFDVRTTTSLYRRDAGTSSEQQKHQGDIVLSSC
ncbi:MAG TPA: hypothetical protein DCR93_22860 [Cytophagales bacterium]|nr:hypothetical protein [Cytophagales bacterium]